MEPVRSEDREGAVCFRPSPELYLGHARGRIGNDGGFKEDSIADYTIPEQLNEGFVYLSGSWASTAEYVEAAGDGSHTIRLQYAAGGVNLVMAAPRGGVCEVVLLQDGKPLNRSQKTPDTRFRQISGGGEESYIAVQRPRMYALVDNHEFGKHALELRCPAGTTAFAFTFTSCIDRAAVAVAAAESTQ
jgi:hypothetical protein